MSADNHFSMETERGGKKPFSNKYFCWGLTAFAVIAASMCVYSLLFHLSNITGALRGVAYILMPVVFGLVMAYLLTPILNYLECELLMPFCNKYGIKKTQKRDSVIRGVGIISTIILFVAIVYGLSAMMVSQIVPSLMRIINNFDTYVNNTTLWINKLLEDNAILRDNVLKMLEGDSKNLEQWLNEFVRPRIGEFIRMVSVSVLGVMKVLWNFIIGLIISVYLMANKEKFAGQAKKIIYAAFKTPVANTIIVSFRFTHKTFIGFISGKIVDSIIIGILCFIGTTLLKTPYAALISVIVGVTNVIPFFGPFLGAIPSTILIFVVDPMHILNCVYFVIFILLLQQFDGNILGPKILGSSTGLTGFWVIFAITVFGGLFGVLGMIVGVPIFAVFYAAIRHLVNTALEKKNLPKETEEYQEVDSIDGEVLHHYVPEYKQRRERRLQKKKQMSK